MNTIENFIFLKSSSNSTKLIFEDGEIGAINFEVWIGENMCASCERISGIYGIKTRTASLSSDLYSILCRGFFIELGLDIRFICKVARVVEAIYESV